MKLNEPVKRVILESTDQTGPAVLSFSRAGFVRERICGCRAGDMQREHVRTGVSEQNDLWLQFR